ncbi:hypothetical protein CBM2626_A230003 [Cupriavidus taiwanensis]|nr:hypothetical protein CBM2626_A230003 [Cupriavidus taiwanensis]
MSALFGIGRSVGYHRTSVPARQEPGIRWRLPHHARCPGESLSTPPLDLDYARAVKLGLLCHARVDVIVNDPDAISIVHDVASQFCLGLLVCAGLGVNTGHVKVTSTGPWRLLRSVWRVFYTSSRSAMICGLTRA